MESLQREPGEQKTYNLEVAEDHSFFVGDAQAWVHNGCQIVTKNGIRIRGFVPHAIDRAIGDTYTRVGVRPQAILDALKNPLKVSEVLVDSLGRESQRFVGKFGEVVVNPGTGKIISVNPTDSKKAARLMRHLGLEP